MHAGAMGAFAQAAGALPAEFASGEQCASAKTPGKSSAVAEAPFGASPSPKGTGGPPPQWTGALSSPRVASSMQLLYPGVSFNYSSAASYSVKESGRASHAVPRGRRADMSAGTPPPRTPGLAASRKHDSGRGRSGGREHTQKNIS